MQRLQTADVLVVEGTGILAWFVRRATGSAYTHAAVYVGENEIAEVGASYPARIARLRYPRYAALRLPGLTVGQAVRIALWCRARAGSRYDWRAIGELVLRLFGGLHACVQDRRRYICTELVLGAYRAAGIDLAPGCGVLTPVELMDLPGLRQVREVVS